MKYLLDTHLLLWAASNPNKLSKLAQIILLDTANTLFFSPASLWEIVIKNSLGRTDFHVEPTVFRRALLDNGYLEMPITSEHMVAIGSLPPIHKDPFDRLLIAQALVEGVVLFSTDSIISKYPGPIQMM